MDARLDGAIAEIAALRTQVASQQEALREAKQAKTKERAKDDAIGCGLVTLIPLIIWLLQAMGVGSPNVQAPPIPGVDPPV